METITKSIEGQLKLKIKREKTKISQPYQSRLLGFSFYRNEGEWKIRIAPKSLERIKEKLRSKTKRNDPSNAAEKVKKIEAMVRGWVNYFPIVTSKSLMKRLDEMVRVRLSMCIWKQWKKPKTKISNLVKLGVSHWKAYQWGNNSIGYCPVEHSPVLCTTLNNEYFQRLGYVRFYNHYNWKTAQQLKLF